MYCAKCGMPVNRVEGIWTCSSGQFALSARLGDRLAARFEADSKPLPLKAHPPQMRLDLWYCPGCGVALDAAHQCPDCNESLTDFMYELVELHPHGGRDR
jgi:hypothetical protein